jgi:hypothetical protein
MSDLHLIFTEEKILVSRKVYSSWQEIQAQFQDFKTSLGPWNDGDVVAWLREEYDDIFPTAQQQVEQFLNSDEESRALTFRAS